MTASLALLDLLVVTLCVAVAGGYSVWHLALRRAAPSCAPAGKTKPNVILGGRLARALASRGTGR